MDYYESAEDIYIDRNRALLELKKHSCDDESIIMAFDAEVKANDNGLYNAQHILNWLGY